MVKSIICVSTANTELFDTNYRNDFTNYLPILETNFSESLTLASLHVEKTFRTVGKIPSIFIVIYLELKFLEKEFQDIIKNINKDPHIRFNTLHKHYFHLFKKKNKTFIEFVLVLRPGRYKNNQELTGTINHDFDQLGIKNYIYFSQIPKFPISGFNFVLTPKIHKCIISSKLTEILGLNFSKTIRQEQKINDITQRKLQKITYVNFLKTDKKRKTIGFEIIPGNYTKTIRSLASSTQRDFYLPSLIKVYCSQIQETIESSKYSRLLAVCPGIDQNNREIYEYEPINQVCLPIANSHLNKLHFELKDSNDNLLELDVGTATYIRVKIEPINNNLKMDYLNIFSNDKISKKLYTNNQNNSFTIQLPSTLTLGTAKRWTMKLTTLSIPRTDFNIIKEFGFIEVKCSKKNFTIQIPSKEYSDVTELLNAILEASKIHWGSDSSQIGLGKYRSERYVKLINHFYNMEVSFGFPLILAYILGIKNNIQTIPGLEKESDISNVTIPDSWKPVFSDEYVWVHIKQNSEITFPYLPHLNAAKPRHAKILCTEVKPTIFAGNYENLLSFYSLHSGLLTRDMYFYQFHHPLEVEINSQHLDSLTFKITPENSTDNISFSSTRTPVYMSIIITRYN